MAAKDKNYYKTKFNGNGFLEMFGKNFKKGQNYQYNS